MSEERMLELTMAHQDMMNEVAIKSIQNKASGYVLPPNGRCHSCGEFFDKKDPSYDTRRFCDKECEEDWQDFYDSQKRKFGPNIKPTSAY